MSGLPIASSLHGFLFPNNLVLLFPPFSAVLLVECGVVERLTYSETSLPWV